MLNAKGTTPAEVLGIYYKSTVKSALDSLADDINKSSMEKLEELISVQQQSVEIAAKIEGTKTQIVALQSRIDEVEADSDLLKKEMWDCTPRCAMEAKRCQQDVEAEAHNLDIVEREAAEMLKVANLNLHEAVKQSERKRFRCLLVSSLCTSVDGCLLEIQNLFLIRSTISDLGDGVLISDQGDGFFLALAPL